MRPSIFVWTTIVSLIVVGLYKLDRLMTKGFEIEIDNCLINFRLKVSPKKKTTTRKNK
jgi:hypothetical protein